MNDIEWNKNVFPNESNFIAKAYGRHKKVTTLSENRHTFSIPVMGTGFSIDTPLRVAQYGISSVISLGDDILIEQMRKFHAERVGEPYEVVTNQDEDARARRITLYLNLVNRLVQRQVQALKTSPFSKDSGIARYFKLLPDIAPKRLYREMLAEDDGAKKVRMQERLRTLVVPGSIDVNIMAKMNTSYYHGNQKKSPEYAIAMSALRGFAMSTLHSSIVFSAGINQHLYTYLTRFEDFFPGNNGEFKKKVILKVSDFRSAEVQGRFLAKRGIWVSEYRIESGLNCGGHAFPTMGFLLAPILEQLKNRKHELIEKLFKIYNKALADNGRAVMDECPTVRFTVQGGIGSSAENDLLLDYFDMDGTGWGTPFLLVPEVTNVDKDHLSKLSDATGQDVFISNSSPLGIPFWNLRNSDSENARRRRISEGHPGSPCPKGYLVSNTEFSEVPVCVASRTYQKSKLKSLEENGYTQEQLAAVSADVLAKSCICNDLSGSVKVKNGIELKATPALCCGQDIVNFSKIATLEEMVDHIYGRGNLLTHPDRPHMFIQEMRLYIDYLREEIHKFSLRLSFHKRKYFADFKKNLFDGLEYYQRLTEMFDKEERNRFLDDLKSIYNAVETLDLDPIPAS
ncbi:MAG: hypothetical protein U9N45_00970 [Gemmatimonadota bacterium]|nr:hypothetical protein [Gemmatimonadota bacterium]